MGCLRSSKACLVDGKNPFAFQKGCTAQAPLLSRALTCVRASWSLAAASCAWSAASCASMPVACHGTQEQGQ